MNRITHYFKSLLLLELLAGLWLTLKYSVSQRPASSSSSSRLLK